VLLKRHVFAHPRDSQKQVAALDNAAKLFGRAFGNFGEGAL
jgi:hypothetical protein